ncbi:MAG TPA: helix-turn-helix domain-containing protein [Pseudonocardia sp.]
MCSERPAGRGGGRIFGDVDPFRGDQDSQPLPDWVREMAACVDLQEHAERVVVRDITVAFPSLAGDADFAEHLRSSVRENVYALQQVLCGRLGLAHVRLVQPLEFARVQARLRIPQTALQPSYRVGFVTMWQAWAQHLRAVAEAKDVPREEATASLARLTTMIFAYQDHMASQVAEQHARSDDALNRSRAHVRHGLVREILRTEVTSLPPSDLEQAQDVEKVRAARGRTQAPPVLAHRDVALEILLLREPERARGFVRAGLRALADDTAEAARLRETLYVSFRLGTHVATAERLQLHEHTVRNRLHRAEEHIGHPLHERRTELQVALRLLRLLGDEQ